MDADTPLGSLSLAGLGVALLVLAAYLRKLYRELIDQPGSIPKLPSGLTPNPPYVGFLASFLFVMGVALLASVGVGWYRALFG